MIYIVILLGLIFIVAERIFPNKHLDEVKGWWLRIFFINAFQIGIVFLGSYTWEKWLGDLRVFQLDAHFSSFVCALFSYFVITFVFYWWHRWRHTSNFLWLLCHQLHHSATRIETITSFYKHPVEIILDSILICIINQLLGIGLDGSAFVLLLTAVAEYFYHMNIKTPYWLGFFFQRPEMHHIHHERSKHFKNFSDLPMWDLLFGTFENPKENTIVCGFQPHREQQFTSILLFRNVNNVYKPARSKKWKYVLPVLVCLIGSLQTLGHLTHNKELKGLGFMTAASPLPIVFTSVNGVETFSLAYELRITTRSGKELCMELDPKTYAKLCGPYNRRNVYGAAFGYAPVLPDSLRTKIYVYGFTGNAPLLKEFGITEEVKNVAIHIHSKTKNDNRTWNYSVSNNR